MLSRLVGSVALAVAGIVVLVWPGSAAAQSVGVKGGLALSQVVFSDSFADTTPMAPGLVGGGYVRFGLPWHLALQLEGLVAELRPVVNDVQENRLRYVEVPALLRIRLSGGPGGRLVHLIGGAMVRRLISADETVADETYSVREGIAEDDLALVVGGDIEITPRWAVDARYVHGRDGVYRRFGGGYAGTHRTVQVMVSYALKR